MSTSDVILAHSVDVVFPSIFFKAVRLGTQCLDITYSVTNSSTKPLHNVSRMTSI